LVGRGVGVCVETPEIRKIVLFQTVEAEGFSTFFHPRDLGPGGNVPIWMDEALMNSAQTLALYSPDYIKDKAVYSKAERYASFFQDPTGDKRKLIPVVLRETTFTPLTAMLSRIEVKGSDAG
jgi:TIR domain